jgi:mannosyltransferase
MRRWLRAETNPAGAARDEAAALAAILLLAAAIRLAAADFGFWFDELATLTFAGQPLSHLWSDWMVRETNPPLFYTLVAGWRALFGEGEVALRTLPVLIGLGSIVLAWAMARKMTGATAAMLVAAMLAIAPAHVEYSLALRGYVLGYAAVLAALLAAMTWRETASRGWLIAYVAATLVALYSHTTLILFAAVAGATMLWLVRRDRAKAAAWIVANIAILAGWSWWGWISWRQAAVPTPNFGWIERPGLFDALDIVGGATVPGMLQNGGAIAALMLIAMMLWIGRWLRRGGSPDGWLLAAAGFGVPLLLFAISQKMPVLLPRTAWMTSGAVTLLLAMSFLKIERAPTRRLVIAATLLFEAVMLAQWLPQRAFEAWRETIADIASRDPDALLLVDDDAMALAAGEYRDRLAPGLRIAIVPGVARTHDRWGDGLAAVPRIAPGDVRSIVAHETAVYTLSRGDHDLRPLLRECCAAEVPEATRAPIAIRWRLRDQSGDSIDSVSSTR